MRDSVQQAYTQIITQTLEEGRLKDFAMAVGVAGTIAGAMLSGPDTETKQDVRGTIQQALVKPAKQDPEHLTSKIVDKFTHVDHSKARQIVDAALKYSHPVFPQAHHLLALAGIESSFNENAKSKLKRDPAVGLTQIRPGIWNIPRKELSTVDGQMRHAANILKIYHAKTGNQDHAIKAYNIGLTNLNKGKKQDAAERYINKFKDEASRY